MAKDQQIDRYRKPDSLVRGVGGKTDAELYVGAVAAVKVIRFATPSFLCEQCGCGVLQAMRLLDLMVENRLGILRRSFRGSLFEYMDSVVEEVDYRGPRVQQTLPLGDLPFEGKPVEVAARPAPQAIATERSLSISKKDGLTFAQHLRPVIDGIALNDQNQRVSKSVLTALYLCLTEDRVGAVDVGSPDRALSGARF